jgi:hypothetical protein
MKGMYGVRQVTGAGTRTTTSVASAVTAIRREPTSGRTKRPVGKSQGQRPTREKPLKKAITSAKAVMASLLRR